jgi:hypothetical protein
MFIPLFLFSSLSYGSDIVNFESYASKLSNDLYPQINKYLLDYDNDLTNKDILIIERETLEIISKFIKDDNIPIVQPPKVQIVIAENQEYKGWVLITQISILDEEESINETLMTWSIFGKTFVIHLKVKNKTEI